MKLMIKRARDENQNKVRFKAEYHGVGGWWIGWGDTPHLALQALIGDGHIAGFVFADTVQESWSNEWDDFASAADERERKLHKKNAALRKELKGLKK